MSIRNIKQKALQNIDYSVFSHISFNIIGYTILMSFITSMASYTFIGGLLIGGAMQYGISRLSVLIAREKPANVGNLFDAFKECFVDTMLLGLLSSIYILLWSLLFIIPGIVKSYSYSLAFYIQQDSPNKDWKYCLEKSIQLMHGNKMTAFLLDLSFIGWYILGLLLCGIGIIFVTPYHLQARANFYIEILKKNGLIHEEITINEETLINNEISY